MTVIGFRVSTKEIRYAVLEKRDNSIAFLNKDSENLIKFPTSILITLELEYCIIHKTCIEYAYGAQQLEVLDIKTCDLIEKLGSS